MYYALLIEPEYGDTYWGHQFSKEIQIQSRKLGYHKVPFDRHTPSLILGSDPQWLVKAMSQAGNVPHVLLNCNPQTLPKLASTVSFDYAGSLRTAQEFLQANALSRPALFVVNRNSTNDCYLPSSSVVVGSTTSEGKSPATATGFCSNGRTTTA